MIDPLEETQTRRVRDPRDRRPTGEAQMRDPSVVSLSLSCARKSDEENIDAKKIDIHIKISFEFKKITPPGSSPRKLSPDIISLVLILVLIADDAHKKRTFIGAAGIFAPLKDDDLFADEDGARIVASGWTVSVEDNIY